MLQRSVRFRGARELSGRLALGSVRMRLDVGDGDHTLKTLLGRISLGSMDMFRLRAWGFGFRVQKIHSQKGNPTY